MAVSVGLVACGSLNRNLYHAETLAVDGVRGGTHTYNAWLATQTNTADTNALAKLYRERDQVYGKVRNFGALTKTVDNLRLSYATNSANTNLTALQTGVTALESQSQDIIDEITAAMSGKPIPWPQTP